MAIETVYLAGGCYWGLEDLLNRIPGVVNTSVGFSGGHVKNDASGVFKNKITTEVNSFNSFFPAEDNHQKYLQKYPDGYTCHFLRDINFVI
ncbi:MAG: hypothetical protein EB109_04700 [Methylophilaceae bacterium]|nr:hypothetical protein [Methylophilaceae bacterium]